MAKAATKPNSLGFVPLATKAETEAFLIHVACLRHRVFTTVAVPGECSNTTNRYFADGHSETWTWNVTEGYEQARSRGDAPGSFDPAEHGSTLAHILTRYPGLDVRYALNRADLSEPVLLVPAYEVVAGERVETLLLIDDEKSAQPIFLRWHRLFRSVVETIETGEARPLHAYSLTEDEAAETPFPAAKAIQVAPLVSEPGSVPTGMGTLALRQLSRR